MMPLWLIFALVALLTVFLQAWRKNKEGKWQGAPPGPFFLPLLGSTWSVATTDMELITAPLLTMTELAKTYGDVFLMVMGSQDIVFLNSLESIKEYASKEETTYRPTIPTLLEMYSDGKDLGMGIGTGGPRWRELRRFSARALRDLGAGKKGMDEKVMREVEHTIEDLRGRCGVEKRLRSVDTYFDLPDLNVIWGLVAAKRYDYDDPEAHRQFDYLRAFLQEWKAGPLTAVSFLKVLPYFSGIYWNIRHTMNNFRHVIRQVVKEQRETFDASHERGFIDKFIVEEKKKGHTHHFFNEDDLIICCQDLFIAGSETTSKTLSYAFLWLVLYPEVQRRIQEEIDTHVGRDRHVTMEDKVNLPYTEATLAEVRRISTPFPITPPRTAPKDVMVKGFRIPAGVTVQMNIYAVLRDEKNFEDPKVFRPERFLDANNNVVYPDAFIPFGYGKRRCLGENLANVSNFLFMANLLQAFTFSVVDPKRPPSTRPFGGLTYGPQPFDVRITPRD